MNDPPPLLSPLSLTGEINHKSISDVILHNLHDHDVSQVYK